MVKKVSFWATKKILVPEKVCFKTRSGTTKCFIAKTPMNTRQKVEFYAKIKPQKFSKKSLRSLYGK